MTKNKSYYFFIQRLLLSFSSSASFRGWAKTRLF